jgi:hypothetical protein
MYELIDVIEFLLQSSYRNPIELNSYMMYDDWALYQELFMYFDII